jgi:hypothetical protein
MNTSCHGQTRWLWASLWLVFASSSLPCHGQQPSRTEGTPNEVQQLREMVARLEVENRTLRLELEQTKAVVAALQKSEREAIAGLNVVQQIRASQDAANADQQRLFVEVRRLRELFQAVHGKTLATEETPVTERKSASKPDPNDPFSRNTPVTEKKSAPKPDPSDPFSQPAPRSSSPK